MLALMAGNHAAFSAFPTPCDSLQAAYRPSVQQGENNSLTSIIRSTSAPSVTTGQRRMLLMNCAELFVLDRLYSRTFQPRLAAPTGEESGGEDGATGGSSSLPSTAWADRDARVSAIAAALAPVLRPSHLDICDSVDPSTPHARPHINEAIRHLSRLAQVRTPLQKMQCFLRCCHAVCLACASAPAGTTHAGKGKSSADNVFPLLVWVLVHANPPCLLSNIEYVSTFRHPDLLVGESAYYFLTISAAVSFLETLKRDSLALDSPALDAYVVGPWYGDC